MHKATWLRAKLRCSTAAIASFTTGVHLLGLEGLVVVATGDTIMVCKKDHAQEVKKFVAGQAPGKAALS